LGARGGCTARPPSGPGLRREQGLHNLIIMSYMCIVNVLVLLSFFLAKRVTVLIVNKWRSTADLQLSDT